MFVNIIARNMENNKNKYDLRFTIYDCNAD